MPGMTYRPVRYSLVPLVGSVTVTVCDMVGVLAGIIAAKLPRFLATAELSRLM